MFVKLDPALEAMGLEVGTPEKIEEGMMWLEPIDNIFTKRSCDHADPKGHNGRSWEDVLEGKRDDYDYYQTKDSIETYGFVRPVTAQAISDGRDYKYGDGHHRLAAAIDLGFTHVPVVATEGYYAISRDSGAWSGSIDEARAMSIY